MIKCKGWFLDFNDCFGIGLRLGPFTQFEATGLLKTLEGKIFEMKGEFSLQEMEYQKHDYQVEVEMEDE